LDGHTKDGAEYIHYNGMIDPPCRRHTSEQYAAIKDPFEKKNSPQVNVEKKIDFFNGNSIERLRFLVRTREQREKSGKRKRVYPRGVSLQTVSMKGRSPKCHGCNELITKGDVSVCVHRLDAKLSYPEVKFHHWATTCIQSKLTSKEQEELLQLIQSLLALGDLLPDTAE
jgi:hypothetical protein